ncbi:hypothetical protein DA717_13060 [Piscirickettsiaceae bacterium NZ-RLO2]|nr:hypothetical protein DA717_13060 [Piscirickettsiaceae bacterium NZ-RLO2]
MKIIVHAEASVIANKLISEYNSGIYDNIGSKTLEILQRYQGKVTPEQLFQELFLSRNQAVYAESIRQCTSAGYNQNDWKIMSLITPIVHNVHITSNANIHDKQYEYQSSPRQISVVGLSGVLPKRHADQEGLTKEEYKEKVKQRMLPTLRHLAKTCQGDTTFTTPAVGCGAWDFGNLSRAQKTKAVRDALYESVDEINRDFPDHKVKTVKFFGMRLAQKTERIGSCDVITDRSFNAVHPDDDNDIYVGMAGDPFAPLGSDVFKSGRRGGTGERFVTHTNLGDQLYGIEGLVKNEAERDELADKYQAHYRQNEGHVSYRDGLTIDVIYEGTPDHLRKIENFLNAHIVALEGYSKKPAGSPGCKDSASLQRERREYAQNLADKLKDLRHHIHGDVDLDIDVHVHVQRSVATLQQLKRLATPEGVLKGLRSPLDNFQKGVDDLMLEFQRTARVGGRTATLVMDSSSHHTSPERHIKQFVAEGP